MCPTMSSAPPVTSAGFLGPRLRHPRVWLALLAGLLTDPLVRAATIEATPRLEYQVKAGYLFNFLRFTEWPSQALSAGTPYRIGIAGDAAAFNIIADVLQGKTVNDREIEVVHLKAGDSVRGCHLIFVPRTIDLDALNLSDVAQRDAVLMVGESNNYAVRDGMIGFVQRGHNIRFQVNLSAAQRAGLKLSGRLASLAEIVPSRAP